VKCVPLRSIYICPDRKDRNTFALYGQKDFIPNTTQYHRKKMDISLPLIVKKSPVYVFYGDGVWTDSLVNQISHSIDSVIITNKKGTIKYGTNDEIKSYLLSHRQGRLKQMIRLTTK
jgi:hypothetical protein